MRKLLVGVIALGLAAVGTASAAGATPHKDHRFTIAVYGDSPYGNSQTSPPDTRLYDASPGFINTINGDPDVSLVAHVGDIHSGKEFCTEAYDNKIKALWGAFDGPLVYTPGDNEWSDCHKPGEGGGKWATAADGSKFIDFNCTGCFGDVDYARGNPLDNLALVRSLFFPRPGKTLGGSNFKVSSQAKQYDHNFPTDKQFVENVQWEQNDIVFVTLNIPGGSNDDADPWYGSGTPTSSPLPQQQADERAQRQGADLRWLDAAFGAATKGEAKAVVILEQADMWDTDGKANHLGNYEPYVASIASHTSAFGKPVLLFNGDSHIYRSDDPLQSGAPCTMENQATRTETTCAQAATDNPTLNITADAWQNHPSYNVANFHRVTVHGSSSLEWLKLDIDPDASNPPGSTSFGPFAWAREPYTP